MSLSIDPVLLSNLYRWIDTIPLDRPKKNIARDFSDGVLMSQVLHYFFPKLVDLHNYSSTHAIEQKQYNWKTLNQKVFKKMGFMISTQDIDNVVQIKKFAIERILLLVQVKIGEYQSRLASGEAVEDAAPAPAPAPARAQSPKARMSHSPPHKKASPSSPQTSQQQPAHKSSSSSITQETMIQDLRETVDILQLKVQKLEQLLRLKNSKIASLQKRLEDLGQPL